MLPLSWEASVSIWDTKVSFFQGLGTLLRSSRGSLGALHFVPAIPPTSTNSHVRVCGTALSLLLSGSLHGPGKRPAFLEVWS